MDSKDKAIDTLDVFCKEFVIPINLTFDASKEQDEKNTKFVTHIRKYNIHYHVTETEFHQQSLAKFIIREVARKWYRVMICKQVPARLWDYCITWVADIMSLTHTFTWNINGCVPLSRLIGETADISEY